jgi:hypothetical protein
MLISVSDALPLTALASASDALPPTVVASTSLLKYSILCCLCLPTRRVLTKSTKYYRSNNQSEGLVAPADYGSPLCEWWVGVSVTTYFFLLAFFVFLSGQVMLLVTSGSVRGMSPSWVPR